MTTLILGVLGIVTKVLLDERAGTKEARREIREVRADHEECMERHAIQSEILGGLKESVRILTQYQPQPVRQQVQAALDVVDAKAEARVEARRNTT